MHPNNGALGIASNITISAVPASGPVAPTAALPRADNLLQTSGTSTTNKPSLSAIGQGNVSLGPMTPPAMSPNPRPPKSVSDSSSSFSQKPPSSFAVKVTNAQGLAVTFRSQSVKAPFKLTDDGLFIEADHVAQQLFRDEDLIGASVIHAEARLFGNRLICKGSSIVLEDPLNISLSSSPTSAVPAALVVANVQPQPQPHTQPPLANPLGPTPPHPATLSANDSASETTIDARSVSETSQRHKHTQEVISHYRHQANLQAQRKPSLLSALIAETKCLHVLIRVVTLDDPTKFAHSLYAVDKLLEFVATEATDTDRLLTLLKDVADKVYEEKLLVKPHHLREFDFIMERLLVELVRINGIQMDPSNDNSIKVLRALVEKIVSKLV